MILLCYVLKICFTDGILPTVSYRYTGISYRSAVYAGVFGRCGNVGLYVEAFYGCVISLAVCTRHFLAL